MNKDVMRQIGIAAGQHEKQSGLGDLMRAGGKFLAKKAPALERQAVRGGPAMGPIQRRAWLAPQAALPAPHGGSVPGGTLAAGRSSAPGPPNRWQPGQPITANAQFAATNARRTAGSAPRGPYGGHGSGPAPGGGGPIPPTPGSPGYEAYRSQQYQQWRQANPGSGPAPGGGPTPGPAPVSSPGPAPGGASPRNIGRMAARGAGFAGLGGAGVLGYGHATAENGALRNYMADPEQQYQAAQDQYKSMLPAQTAATAQRASYEASPEYNSWANQLGRNLGLGGTSADELRRQTVAGEFGGGGGPSLGGLNPWHQANAAGQLNAASQAANKMTQQYQDIVDQHPPAELQGQIDSLEAALRGAVMPEQRQMIEQELQRVRGQLAGPHGTENPAARQLRQRMMRTGMSDPMRTVFSQPSGEMMGPPHPDSQGASMPYASLANDPWGLRDQVQQYAIDPQNDEYFGFKARP